MAVGPVSSLNLRDNLITNLLDTREVMKMVYASDFGYNKVQQIMDLMNPFGSIRVENPKFEVGNLGNLSVAQGIGANSVLSGTNLLVTLSAPNTNFRVKDIVADSNFVQGRIEQVISSTQFILSPVSNSSWNVATQFTSGMIAKRMFDASGNEGSRGKTSLTYVPQLDFNLTAISRDTTVQYRRDRIGTYVNWKGKYWWTSQQDLMLKSFSKQLEWKYMYSERHQKSGVEGDYNTTGGIRWNVINNGGSYFPIANQLTLSSFNDILYQFGMTVADNNRQIIALMGKQAMFNLQIQQQPFVQTAGTNNVFGGADVVGLNMMKYAIGGMEINYSNYALFDDPVMNQEISTITGQPKNSSSILLIDTTPVESADGSGTIAPIQKRYFGEKEFYHNFLPGMIGIDSDKSTAIKSGDAELSVSDIDGVEMEIMCDDGLYIIPQRFALIELTN